MKLNVFLPNLDPGGAENVCVTLVNELSRSHDVTLYVNDASGVLRSKLSGDVTMSELKFRSTFRNLFQIRCILKANPTVSSLSFLTHQNIVVLLASLGIRRGRIVISERNNLKKDLENERLFKRLLLSFLVRTLYRLANKIVCVSEGVKQSVVECVGQSSNSMVIYNPVLDERVSKLSDQPLEQSDKAFVGDRTLFLNVGRLEIQKNQMLLLRSFKRLNEVHKDVCLVLLGEGQERPKLEKYVEENNLGENVLLKGFVANPFPWFKNANCFVLSSDFEGLPGVLVQALACSERLVSTDCPDGPKEILLEGKLGQLVPVSSVEHMVDALKNVKQGRVGFVDFEDRKLGRFSVEENVSEYQRVLFE